MVCNKITSYPSRYASNIVYASTRSSTVTRSIIANKTGVNIINIPRIEYCSPINIVSRRFRSFNKIPYKTLFRKPYICSYISYFAIFRIVYCATFKYYACRSSIQKTVIYTTIICPICRSIQTHIVRRIRRNVFCGIVWTCVYKALIAIFINRPFEISYCRVSDVGIVSKRIIKR